MSKFPSDWSFEPLGKGCKVQGGFAFKSRDYTKNGNGVPIIKIGDLQNGRVHVGEKSTRVPEEFLDDRNLAKFLLEDGDILIAMTGATTGKIGRYDRASSGTAYLNQRVGRFVVDGERFHQEFIQFLTQTEVFQQRIQENILAAAQGNISPKKLEGIPIPLPPLSEQKNIAHILSTVQRAIEAQERIIQTTTELKKALMHKLFTEGISRSGGKPQKQKQTEIGPVPESWEVVDLGDVINLFAGYAFKSKEGVPESNTQLLRMGNLYQNTLDLSRKPIFYPDSFAEDHRRFVLKEGDMVMSLTGTSGKEDYGFTVQIPRTEKTLLLNQRVTRIDITDDRLHKDFAHHFLLSRKFLDFLYPTAKGMKQANLSTNAMKKLKVVLPDPGEQKEIATCFKSLDQKVVVAGNKVAALQDLFRTLLHELMTAKTRVHKLDTSI